MPPPLLPALSTGQALAIATDLSAIGVVRSSKTHCPCSSTYHEARLHRWATNQLLPLLDQFHRWSPQHQFGEGVRRGRVARFASRPGELPRLVSVQDRCQSRAERFPPDPLHLQALQIAMLLVRPKQERKEPTAPCGCSWHPRSPYTSLSILRYATCLRCLDRMSPLDQ